MTIWLFNDNSNLKFKIILIWVTSVLIGSISWFYLSYLESNITWVDVSYILLPLTVFVSYLKSYKKNLC